MKQHNLEELTDSIHTIAVEMREMRTSMERIQQRVDEVESKPAKRYESIIAAIISSIVAFVIGYFLKR